MFPYGILLSNHRRTQINCITSNITYLLKKKAVDDLIERYSRYSDDITSFGFNIAFVKCTCKMFQEEGKQSMRLCMWRETDMP